MAAAAAERGWHAPLSPQPFATAIRRPSGAMRPWFCQEFSALCNSGRGECRAPAEWCGASRFSTNTVIPDRVGDRHRGIQYAAAFRLNHECLGLLGRPVKPGDDGRECDALRFSAKAVIPRQRSSPSASPMTRGIQYPAAFRLNHERLGVRGHQVIPDRVGDRHRAMTAGSVARRAAPQRAVIPRASLTAL
jgi:hypothetical protein